MSLKPQRADLSPQISGYNLFIKIPRNEFEPYSALGIQLSQVDVFYHYHVERRQNILRLFSEYGKNGAILVFLKAFEDSFTIPENVAQIEHHGDNKKLALYQKIDG